MKKKIRYTKRRIIVKLDNSINEYINEQITDNRKVIIYSEKNLNGKSFTTNCDVDFVGDFFNGNDYDSIKSIKVLSGTWEFYKDAGCKTPLLLLQKGEYNFELLIEKSKDNLLKTKVISSFKCLDTD